MTQDAEDVWRCTAFCDHAAGQYMCEPMPYRACPDCGNKMPQRAAPGATCRPCRRRHSDGDPHGH